MANFEERLKERNASLKGKGTFVERMEAIGDTILRKWVICDLSEMTDTAMWSVASAGNIQLFPTSFAPGILPVFASRTTRLMLIFHNSDSSLVDK